MFSAIRRSIYIQLVAVFSAALLLVMVIIVPINMRARARSRAQYIESTLAKAGFFLDMLGYEIRAAQDRLLSLINDKILGELAPLPGIEYVPVQIKMVQDAKDTVTSIAGMSRYIKEVTVFLPRHERQIDSRFYYQAIDQDLYARLADEVRAQRQPFIALDGRFFTAYGQNLGALANGAYNFIVAIEWDLERIGASLADVSASGDSSGRGGALLIGGYGGIDATGRGVDTTDILSLRERVESRPGADRSSGTLWLDGTPILYVWRASGALNSTLVIYENEALLNRFLAEYGQSLFALLGVAFVSALAYAYFLHRFIARPVRELKAAFQRLERENFGSPAEDAPGNDLHLLFAYFRRMVERTDQLIEQIYRQRILVQKAELKQLQSQINPHFLHNSLLCARNLIKMGNDDAAESMLRHLSSYYEYITREAMDEVPLGAELAHVRNYVGVQAVRFMNRLAVAFDPTPEDVKELPVPRLIVQPLVENAFEHGLRGRAGAAELAIRIASDARTVEIAVEDNGLIDDAEIERIALLLAGASPNIEVSGIQNVHRRLVYAFGEGSGLSVKRGAAGGLCISMRMRKGEADA